jgi:prolyl-tRNA editing enzyme YbaK/EbsC (Cys-tRNA(Pro) deacylase)
VEAFRGATAVPDTLSPSARRFQEALQGLGFDGEVVEMPQATRTAVEAAAALGCRLEQIVKSLVFRGVLTGRPILVLVSGGNRASEERLAGHIGEPVGKAQAEFVRVVTGYAIGGVPPLGHAQSLETLVDEDLLGQPEIWAAAGHPNALFRLTPGDLVRLTGGRVVTVR